MKRLNSKGLTLTELIVSFAIVAVAAVYFYQTIYTVRRLYTTAQTETQEYVDKNYAIRVVDAYIDRHGYGGLENNNNNDSKTKICDAFSLKYLKSDNNCSKIIAENAGDVGEKLKKITINWDSGKKVSFHKADVKPVVQEYVLPVLAENGVNKSLPFFNNTDPKISKTSVRSITFQTNIDTPDGYNEDDSWDASQGKKKTVKAWYKLGEGGLYDIVIGAEGKVVFPVSCNGMFDRLYNLKEINFNGAIDTSQVKSMVNMFSNCNKLVGNLDLSDFNTVNVESMELMFYGCSKLENITFGSNFTAKKVGTMQQMFNRCGSLKSLDLSRFDTDSLTKTYMMFSGCYSLGSITFGSEFTTNIVDQMGSMFEGCSGLNSLDLSKFNTNVATNADKMFSGCTKLQSITFGDQFIIKSATSMFWMCSKLESLNLSSFNTKAVTSMYQMFHYCTSLESITFGKDFVTNGVTNMREMFESCRSLIMLDLNNFTFDIVSDYSRMFASYPDNFRELPIYVKDAKSKEFLLKVRSDLRNIIIGKPSV